MSAPGPDDARARSRPVVHRLHAVTDRVPTAWLSGILTAAFLAVAAAFGGLEAVAAPPVATLEPDQTHRNDQLALTVERAVLIDELPEAGAYPEEGQRVLAVVVTAENVWDRAIPAHSPTGVSGSIVAPRLDERMPGGVARFDDATPNPWLQPGLPAQLVMTWVIDADELSDGDEVRLEVRDFSLQSGQLILSGQWWGDAVAAATVDLEVTDVGAGADAAADGGGQ